MIALFTDFGTAGPYLGQMKRVCYQEAPGVPLVDLFADAPRFDPRASAYLLASYCAGFPEGSVFIGVVDPGVGSGERPGVVIRADDYWFVGPGNGLFDIVAARAADVQGWEIGWEPALLSATFHGRDLFAPVGAAIVRGRREVLGKRLASPRFQSEWPDELPEIIYLDHYGNAISGLRADSIPETTCFSLLGRLVRHATTFARAPAGELFWYRNSNGLVEFAANRQPAAALGGLSVGTPVEVIAEGE